MRLCVVPQSCFRVGIVRGHSRGILQYSVACECSSKDAGLRSALLAHATVDASFHAPARSATEASGGSHACRGDLLLSCCSPCVRAVPSVQYVWFAEDDCRFRTCVTLAELLHGMEMLGGVLVACDSLSHRLWQQGSVSVPPKSLAYQLPHAANAGSCSFNVASLRWRRV